QRRQEVSTQTQYPETMVMAVPAKRLGIRRRRLTVGGVVKVVGLSLWLIITFFPLYWILITSFKAPGTINRFPLEYWPTEPSLANYASLFETNNFGVFLGNSALIALVAGGTATM